MTSVSANKGLDKVSFGQAVIRRLKEKGWKGNLTFSADPFSIKSDSDQVVYYLDNTYKDWVAKDTDAERDLVVDRLAKVAVETAERSDHPPTFEQTAPSILPAIRSRAYVENIWMYLDAASTDSFSQASRPLCDWLSVILTINTEASIGTISAKQLTDWGKSLDDVMAVAMTNLKRVKTQAFELHSGGFYVLSSDDYYDPSVLLMPDRIAALPVKGLPVAVAATRGCLVVAGSDDPSALRNMAAAVEEIYSKDSHPISYFPIVLKDGKWQPFVPDRAAYPMIYRLRSLEFLASYASQLAALNTRNKKNGRDVYVGQLDAIEDGEKLITWSSLVSGITTLLPVSDVVVVAPADLKNPFVRRFADVMTVAGNRPLEPNTWPPLYVFKDGVDQRLLDFLHDRYPQPEEFPAVGKS